MPYTYNELSGICYEITGLMSRVMDDAFTEAERELGDAVALSRIYLTPVALASAFLGVSGAVASGLGEVAVAIFSDAKERELRELKADISTGKIETAIYTHFLNKMASHTKLCLIGLNIRYNADMAMGLTCGHPSLQQ